MANWMIGALVAGALLGGPFGGAPQHPTTLVGGGTEMMLGSWTPGEGQIGPGQKIRGYTAPYLDTIVGPAGELASGTGPVTMNCNIDKTMTGPCWGTFEFENATGTWFGVWQGTFNFATGAGSYHGIGRGHGGLKGMVLEIDAVYPGWAFAPAGGPPVGYVYSTVTKK
jgi:hypothetical protein